MNQITTLLDSLAKEITEERRSEMTKFISHLYMFVHDRDGDDPEDLDTKLKSAKRESELRHAPRALERFEMLLETYRHFPSGQKLFGFFLAHIHDVFCYQIIGKNLTDAEIDEIIQTQIVEKVIADMGVGFEHFSLAAIDVRGMIYYLADRCYVRWNNQCSV